MSQMRISLTVNNKTTIFNSLPEMASYVRDNKKSIAIGLQEELNGEERLRKIKIYNRWLTFTPIFLIGMWFLLCSLGLDHITVQWIFWIIASPICITTAYFFVRLMIMRYPEVSIAFICLQLKGPPDSIYPYISLLKWLVILKRLPGNYASALRKEEFLGHKHDIRAYNDLIIWMEKRDRISGLYVSPVSDVVSGETASPAFAQLAQCNHIFSVNGRVNTFTSLAEFAEHVRDNKLQIAFGFKEQIERVNKVKIRRLTWTIITVFVVVAPFLLAYYAADVANDPSSMFFGNSLSHHPILMQVCRYINEGFGVFTGYCIIHILVLKTPIISGIYKEIKDPQKPGMGYIDLVRWMAHNDYIPINFASVLRREDFDGTSVTTSTYDKLIKLLQARDFLLRNKPGKS